MSGWVRHECLYPINDAQIYRENDKPYYRTGNKVLIALAVYSLVLFVVARFYYEWRNKTKAQKWNAMSSAEREEYLSANKDLGNKRFVWYKTSIFRLS